MIPRPRNILSLMALSLILALLLALALPSASQAQTAPSFNASALIAQAQSGDPSAAYQLGTIEYVGLGVVQDYIGAIRLLTQAGEAGNAEAACEAGFLYQTGSFAQGPPPPDPTDAAPWYKKSAALGNACGEFALANLYQTGQGVAKDPAQAAKLFAAAAAQGLVLDPKTFPLQQLQERFYATAGQITGINGWQDTVSLQAGGSQ